VSKELKVAAAQKTEVAKPKAAKPKAAEPKAAKPKAAKPKSAKPKAAEPEAAEPEAAVNIPKPAQLCVGASSGAVRPTCKECPAAVVSGNYGFCSGCRTKVIIATDEAIVLNPCVTGFKGARSCSCTKTRGSRARGSRAKGSRAKGGIT
jgi:hypothetical protein